MRLNRLTWEDDKEYPFTVADYAILGYIPCAIRVLNTRSTSYIGEKPRDRFACAICWRVKPLKHLLNHLNEKHGFGLKFRLSKNGRELFHVQSQDSDI